MDTTGLIAFHFEWHDDKAEFLCNALEDKVTMIGWKEPPKNVTYKRLIEGIAPKENQEVIEIGVDLIAALFEIESPKISFTEVENKDWVLENQRSFPPIIIEPFFIYGSHIKLPIPPDTIPLLLDAASAFGSGHHESTKGCLIAIDKLASKHSFQNPLDLGCGSGILAMAIAKRCNCPVTASDIDPESVRVTIDNAQKNHIPNLSAFVADGLDAQELAQRAPFDLIVANILAKPLCSLAPSVVASLKTHGYLILSGLLNEQREAVQKAYEDEGAHYEGHIELGEWSTLILKHGS